MIFANRREAGRALASALHPHAGRDAVVLALPRGGVPVAFEVARQLRAPLDVFVVRKLGMPGHEEFAIGAIASGGVRVVNPQMPADPAALDAATTRERAELQRRERLYRGDRPPPSLADKTVIVVDDGLATGSTLRAALLALRQLGAHRLVAAVPIGTRDACRALHDLADEVVCLHTPTPFRGVGEWYGDFAQVQDAEVRELLQRPSRLPSAKGAGAAEEADMPVLEALHRAAWSMEAGDDALLERIGGARLVLIGEASHGTQEFYARRARLTRHLIEEKGFNAVAAEADWPDAYRVNRFVRGRSDDADADAALSGFKRFPTWMWRNTVVRDFVAWLRARNCRCHADACDRCN